MSVTDRLLQAIEREERAALFTVIQGEPLGAKLLVLESGERHGGGVPGELAEQAGELIREARSRVLEAGELRVFCEIYAPPPRLLLFGAVDTAEELCRAAKLLGWRTIVTDARGKFATTERIPSADELIVAWPEEALEQVGVDHATAIVVLTHDDKFDVPALSGALRTEAFYIGALGSRRNQERRRERLLEAGVGEADLGRISGPCGLDIGADSQPETAISILAEMLAVRARRDGGRLQRSKSRIHVEVEETAEAR